MKVAQHHTASEGEDTPHAAQGIALPGEADAISQQELAAQLRAIDWQALRLRLFAGQDRRGVPGEDLAATRLRLRGSFDGCAAVALTAYDDNSKGINLDASSNSKSGTGTSLPVADVNGNGERGLT